MSTVDPVHHWPIGGSTAYRTVNCTQWPLAAAEAKQRARDRGGKPRPEAPNDPATRGTYLHACLEFFATKLKPGDKPPTLADVKAMLEAWESANLTLDLNEAMIIFAAPTIEALADAVHDKVVGAVADILDRFFTPDKQVLFYQVEQAIKAPGAYADVIGGTPDLAVVYRDDADVVLAIADYKSGDGLLQRVDEGGADNPVATQTGFYAALLLDNPPAALAKLSVSHVELIVMHAWRDAFVPTSLRLSVSDFYDIWEHTNVPALLVAADALGSGDDGNVAMSAGDWCKYCPVAKICPELYKEAHQAVTIDPTEAEALAKLLRIAPALTELLKETAALSSDILLGGGKIPGHKLVVSARRSTWVNPPRSKLEALAHGKGYGALYKAMDKATKTNTGVFKPLPDPIMRSPAQVYKALGITPDQFETVYGGLTSKKVSYKVVLETDRRPAALATDAIKDAIKQLANR